MPFAPPSFPLACNLWRFPNIYTNAPDLTFNVNLSLGRRVLAPSGISLPTLPANLSRWFYMFTEFLCPAGTDIRGQNMLGAVGPSDLIEVPAGSARTYLVLDVEDVGKGFGNEYRLAVGIKYDTQVSLLLANGFAAPVWPSPIP